MHLAYYLMQLVLAGICFGISAFLRRGSAGAGLGLAVMLYFLNLIANITPSVKFLKYFTPFSFCEGADIMTNSRLEGTYLIPGCAAGALGILIAFLKYERKDIR